MLNFWKHLNKHPRAPYVYAVTKGGYLGELLVYIKDQDISHMFLSLPQMINREIPIDKFKLGIQEKIVEMVQRLPSGVYKICSAQYNKNTLK